MANYRWGLALVLSLVAFGCAPEKPSGSQPGGDPGTEGDPAASGEGSTTSDGGLPGDSGPGDGGGDAFVPVELCQVCTQASECVTDSTCLEIATSRSACVPACGSSCTNGFDCVSGYCMPASGLCCIDDDADGYGAGADCAGADCDEISDAHWSDCTTCLDLDGDDFGDACNLGGDCAPDDAAHWDDCLTCVDTDGDGFGPGCDLGDDCDDGNAHCTTDCTDGDLDGFCVTTDCNDANAHCTSDCTDGDTDGFCANADCDDGNAHCTSDCTDVDLDGFCVTTDCNDANAKCTSDCTDVDLDGFCVTSDCNDANAHCTSDCTDIDTDGYCATTDCDDADPDSHPGGVEVCDGADNDCLNGADNGTAAALGCVDTNPCTDDACQGGGCIHPNNGYAEACYEGPPLTLGVGNCHAGTRTCSGGGFGACLNQVLPATGETCGGGDEDCDGTTDEEGAAGCVWYRLDADRDGHGVNDLRCYCAPGRPYTGAAANNYDAANSGSYDCNDTTALAHPGATETCAYLYDEDCDGSVDEPGADGCITRYLDNDRDGYGTTASRCWCVPAGPYDSSYSSDCNDSNGAINPGAAEVCDGIDNNCSGTTDTAEIPINILCPLTSHVTTQACGGSPVMCRASACNATWYDIDGTYSNGCEVQEDAIDQAGQGDTCSSYYVAGMYDRSYDGNYHYADITGNIVPAGEFDYYYTYAYDYVPYGQGFAFDARFISNPGNNYYLTIYRGTTCGTIIAQAADLYAFTFTTNTNWVSTPVYGYPGYGQGNCAAAVAGTSHCDTNSFANQYYVIRVGRVSGASPLGETYWLRISNGLYNGP